MVKLTRDEINDRIEEETIVDEELENEEESEEYSEKFSIEDYGYDFSRKVVSDKELLIEGTSYSSNMLDINELMEKKVLLRGQKIDLSNMPEVNCIQAATQEQLDMLISESRKQITDIHLSNNTPVGWDDEYDYQNKWLMDRTIDMSKFKNVERVQTHFYVNNDLEDIVLPENVTEMLCRHSSMKNLCGDEGLRGIYIEIDRTVTGFNDGYVLTLEEPILACLRKELSDFTYEDLSQHLSEIVKAKPKLVSEVFKAINECLLSDKNNRSSLKKAYYILGDIVKVQPELAKECVKFVLQHGQRDNNEVLLECLATCMKHCQMTDFLEVTAEQKQLLQAAHNIRYSTEDEIKYFCENYGPEKLAEMSFSAQQRCMNILISQIGKEQKLSPEETKSWISHYRKIPEANYLYQESANYLYQENKDWLVADSLKAAQTYGSYFPSYIKMTEKYLSAHDAVYWLPKDLSKEKAESFRSFVSRSLIYPTSEGKKVRDLSEMEVIAKNWKYLKPEDEKGKYKDVLAVCQSRKYGDQEYDKFAVEAAKWGMREEEYKDFEGVYKAGLNVPEPFDSGKEFKFGQYTGKFLPRDDVRTGFFGGHTNCCQHFNGVGGACAISTVKDPYSQLFVIENEKGQIVAGSWVWENTEGKYRDVCFDNIEAIGEYSHHRMVNHIYEEAAKYLTEEADCRKVTVGTGYQDADVSVYRETEKVPLPTQYQNKYSDAKETQCLIRENEKARPLDKSQESTRFVRDVCFLDMDAMDRVSEKCFPEGDQRLQAPERLSGLALVDADKGVVGYCLYDKEEKSIYDMAVLPEYRTDKNASSRKLFAEVIRRVKELGGEWSAEMRDKTTYRYLEIMAQRGLVTFEKQGVDHEMSDGSKVYNVTFKVKQPEKTKQNDKVNMAQFNSNTRI